MFRDDPHAGLRELLQAGAQRSSALHAYLFRLCNAHAGVLDTALDSEDGRGFLDRIDHRAGRALASSYSDWSAALCMVLEEFSSAPRRDLLLACAAVLRALDRHHRDASLSVLARHVERLPRELSGELTAFLPPPENPIETRVPDARRLDRGRAHLRHDLRTILDLWWHLIPLENHRASPRFECFEAALVERLRQRLDDHQDLRVGLAAPFAGWSYAFHSAPQERHSRKGTPYRFVGLKPDWLSKARDGLDQILADCKEQSVDIL